MTVPTIGVYRGASLVRNSAPLGPYHMTVPESRTLNRKPLQPLHALCFFTSLLSLQVLEGP